MALASLNELAKNAFFVAKGSSLCCFLHSRGGPATGVPLRGWLTGWDGLLSAKVLSRVCLTCCNSSVFTGTSRPQLMRGADDWCGVGAGTFLPRAASCVVDGEWLFRGLASCIG